MQRGQDGGRNEFKEWLRERWRTEVLGQEDGWRDKKEGKLD